LKIDEKSTLKEPIAQQITSKNPPKCAYIIVKSLFLNTLELTNLD